MFLEQNGRLSCNLLWMLCLFSSFHPRNFNFLLSAVPTWRHLNVTAASHYSSVTLCTNVGSNWFFNIFEAVKDEDRLGYESVCFLVDTSISEDPSAPIKSALKMRGTTHRHGNIASKYGSGGFLKILFSPFLQCSKLFVLCHSWIFLDILKHLFKIQKKPTAYLMPGWHV
jgi:hypothetical protein